MNPEWKARYESAVEAARSAAQIALRYFHQSVAVEWKADASPVTVADRETEQEIRRLLQSRFPGDGFLGEEQGETPSETGFRWIIDPIDGTRLVRPQHPALGHADRPRVQGRTDRRRGRSPDAGADLPRPRGNGAYRNDQRIRVSDVSKLEDSLIFYSSLSPGS